MGSIRGTETIPTFEVSCLSNTEATKRWHQFNDDVSQPGCLVTFLGKEGEAVEYRCRCVSMHFEVGRDFAFHHVAQAFPEWTPATMMVSGRCFEPGCPDYSQRVHGWGVFDSHR